MQKYLGTEDSILLILKIFRCYYIIVVRSDEACTYCSVHAGPQAREVLRTGQKQFWEYDPVEDSCCGGSPHHLVHNQPSFLSQRFHCKHANISLCHHKNIFNKCCLDLCAMTDMTKYSQQSCSKVKNILIIQIDSILASARQQLRKLLQISGDMNCTSCISIKYCPDGRKKQLNKRCPFFFI